MKAHAAVPLVVVLLLVTVLFGIAGAQPAGVQGLVTRVIDGDTIYVAVGNTIEAVRYIGINTPEIHHPTRGREPYGDAAREANRQLVEGQVVTLVFDVQQRDRYGRLLAYVYVGERFVNAELVHRGYAEASSYPPNVRHQDYFRDLERGARSSQRGLWADSQAVMYHRPRAPETAPERLEVDRDDGSARGAPVGASPRVGVPSRAAPAPQPSGGDVNVQGYTRRDGTYVAPHTRRPPRDR